MNRLSVPIRLSVLLPALVAAACAGKERVEPIAAVRPAPPLVEARLVSEALPPPDVSPAPAGPIVQPLPRPALTTGTGGAPVTAAGPPLSRVAAANREAVREPSRGAWQGALQVYAWAEGALYRLYTAPEHVSEIALEPGETLVSVAAGDTVRWVIGDTVSGTGPGRRTHVLVKPTMPGLSTNMVIATDRRVYHVSLESTTGAAMASMSWSYPHGAIKVLDRSDELAAAADTVAGISLDELEFGYAIEGDDPPWRPLRAFDDGTQVFIEFPADLGRGEAPPLFVSGEDGGTELVNYRLRGRYYVVDRLFDRAELRLGARRQEVVRIVRTSPDAERRAGTGGR